MKPLRLGLLALFLASTLAVRADEIRRIGLDGTAGVAAPAQEDGKDGIHRIKKVAQASLEIFATAKKPSHGTVMICPGGGYGILAVNHEGRDVAKLLNDAGWDAAVLLYHVSEGAETRAMALKDAQSALALLQKRGGEFGLSTARLGVMGFSAGGHLAARLGHEPGSASAPAFLVLMYPAYLEKDGIVQDEVAPLKAPTFVYVALDDRYAPSSRAYFAKCKQEGIRCEFYEPAKGGHGFGIKQPLPEGVRDWPEKLRAFLTSVSEGK
jgi:acetyl esterase/lipase